MLVVRQEQDLGAGGTGGQHWEQTGRSGKQEGRCWGCGEAGDRDKRRRREEDAGCRQEQREGLGAGSCEGSRGMNAPLLLTPQACLVKHSWSPNPKGASPSVWGTGTLQRSQVLPSALCCRLGASTLLFPFAVLKKRLVKLVVNFLFYFRTDEAEVRSLFSSHTLSFSVN